MPPAPTRPDQIWEVLVNLILPHMELTQIHGFVVYCKDRVAEAQSKSDRMIYINPGHSWRTGLRKVVGRFRNICLNQ